MSAQCHFYILNRDSPDESRTLWIANNGGGWLTLEEPPVVGDLIFLGQTTDPADPSGETSIDALGTWRVLARHWSPASFGSPLWRTGAQQPSPVWLDVMLEEAEGIFSGSHYGIGDPS